MPAWLSAPEERGAEAGEEPREGEVCGQPGVPEERAASLHLPQVRQREAGPAARHPHHAAAQPRGEEPAVCHRSGYGSLSLPL